MSKDDDTSLSRHHMTAAHLRDEFSQLSGQSSAQEQLAQKHLTSAHLSEALQQGSQSPHVPAQQQQPVTPPASSGSGQSGKE